MPHSREKWEQHVNEPFYPGSGSIEPQYRISNALEYIAAQLGEINRKMDKLIEASGNKSD